jgi:uncharacterized membrane protein YeaQ/YmgE (transglycosylase-associated protein family)
MEILIFLAIGAIAGWLAGEIMRGDGYGLLANIVLGILGAVVGGLLFSALGVEAAGLLGQIIVATIGAMVLVFITHLLFHPVAPVA